MSGKETPLHPLRRARLSLPRPLTQVQLADFAGVSLSTVERAESGKPIRVDCIQRLCDHFGKDAQELGLQAVYAKPKPRQGVAVALSAQQSTGVTLDASSGTQSSQSSTHALRQVRSREIEDVVNRYEFLHNAVRVGGVLLFTTNDESLHAELVDRFSSALQKPSSLDAETLHALKATTQNYRHLFARGSAALPSLFEAAAGHFKLVVQFLKGSLLPSTRTALSAIASETAQFTGWLSADMHLYEQAKAYFDLAVVTAQEANNDALYANQLGCIGWLMSVTSRPDEALVYLEEAQHVVTRCSAYTLVCWSAAEQAEVHADVAVQTNAEQPDDRNCLKSLETMNSYVERIHPEEETFGTFFDSSRPIAYQGSCYMRLKRPHLARPALLSALSIPESAEYTRAILLDLATTSIQEQEIEQACSYIQQSLALILPTHAMRQLHRVRTIREQLEPWAAVEAVRNLDERLHTV
ncbi:MAG: helix-turn-helix transcriptional regulator [Ktedonobacteraceae bacterium]|nr:helix-turn-helix transcriptional regulator [Ktedonobacteraceae bacterium]